MEGFTLVDGGVLFLLAISALLAFSRGLVREVLSIFGWVAAAAVAFFFAADVEPLVREVPVLGNVVGEQCELGILAAFGIVFTVTLIVVSIFTPLISGAVQSSALGTVDQGLGFAYGLGRGALLILVSLIVYERLIGGGEGIAMVDDSRTVEILDQTKAQIAASIPTNAPAWFGERYQQLTGSCDTGAS